MIQKLQKQSLISFKYENNLISSREFFIYENDFEKLSIYVLKDNKIQEISNKETNLIDLYTKKINFDNRVSKINPLECGLYEYISFDKGCYIGQEVIARLHNYEKISRKLTHFISEKPVRKNENIKINNKSIGKIIDFECYEENFFGISLIKKRAFDNFANNGLIYLS
jgi:folate-binding protein YgfZ